MRIFFLALQSIGITQPTPADILVGILVHINQFVTVEI